MQDQDIIFDKAKAFFQEQFRVQQDELFFSLIDGIGIPVDEKAFASTDENNEALEAEEEFSGMVNMLPVFSDDLSTVRGDISYAIDDFYTQLLMDAQPRLAGLDEQQATMIRESFSRKKAEAIMNLEEGRRIGTDNEEYRICKAFPGNWYRADVAWKTHELKIEAAPTANTGKPVMKPQFKLQVSAQELKAMQDPGNTNAAIIKKKNAFMSKLPGTRVHDHRTKQPAASKKRLLIASSVNKLSVSTQPIAGKQSLAIRSGLVPAMSALASRQEAAASSFMIRFEYLNVSVRMDWFNRNFISDTNWFIPSVVKGDYSLAPDVNGTKASLFGLPVSIVLIRKLLISSRNWSDNDKQTLTQSMGFSIFNLQQSKFSGESLSVPGTQIIGICFRKMPILPPNDPE